MPDETAAAQLMRGMTKITLATGHKVVIIDISTEDKKQVWNMKLNLMVHFCVPNGKCVENII